MKYSLKNVLVLGLGFFIGAGTLVYGAAVWQGTDTIIEGQIIDPQVIKDDLDYLYEKVSSSSLSEIGGTPGPGKIIAALDTDGNAEWVDVTFTSSRNTNLTEAELKSAIDDAFFADTGDRIDRGRYGGHGGVYTNKVTRDQVCATFAPGGYSVSYTARAYRSPGDNYAYYYDGSEWRGTSAAAGFGCQNVSRPCSGKACDATGGGPIVTRVCDGYYNNLLSSLVCTAPGQLQMIRDNGSQI